MSETNLFASIVLIIRISLTGKLFDGKGAEMIEPKFSPSGRLEGELCTSEAVDHLSGEGYSFILSDKMIPA